MAIKQYKGITPGLRNTAIVDHTELDSVRPQSL